MDVRPLRPRRHRHQFAFVLITQYYTSGTYRPVREIAEASKTGPATTIISGLAVGFENTAPFVIVISIAIGLAYYLGSLSGLPNPEGFGIISLGGIYGTAVATMGMLMSAGYILAMDSFGPITDNAGGIVEMSGTPDSVRNITDALDGVGNTTKALTKGYGIGSAALAAFLLFSAYLDILQCRTRQPIAIHRESGESADLHRRADRRDADLPLQLAGDSRGWQGSTGHDPRGAAAVPRRSWHHGGHSPIPTMRAVLISARRGAA